ncbi:MAG: DMT family transporter [Nannocystaceae bacterium]|nr:DMT family transporter [Myxococcales bacterium]
MDDSQRTSPEATPTGGPVLWCLLAAALFGASTPASKPLVDALGPLLLSGVLYLGAAVAVAPWALRGLGALRTVDARNLLRLLGAVVFGGMIGPVLLLAGLALAPAGSVSLWLNLETVATAALAWLLFREHLDARVAVAVALIVIASALLSPSIPDGGVAAGLVALACVAWGLDNNLTAVIDRFTPAQVTFAKGLVAGGVNTAAGLLTTTTAIDRGDVGLGLLIGAVSYGASLLLYIAGAQHLGATRSQLVFSTAPLWGLGLAWLALREPIEPAQLVAAALMAAAIWLWHRERHTHHHAHAPTVHRHWHRHDDGHHDHGHRAPVPAGRWHSHEHAHEPVDHEHPHRPDLHHRHAH